MFDRDEQDEEDSGSMNMESLHPSSSMDVSSAASSREDPSFPTFTLPSGTCLYHVLDAELDNDDVEWRKNDFFNACDNLLVSTRVPLTASLKRGQRVVEFILSRALVAFDCSSQHIYLEMMQNDSDKVREHGEALQVGEFEFMVCPTRPCFTMLDDRKTPGRTQRLISEMFRR